MLLSRWRRYCSLKPYMVLWRKALWKLHVVDLVKLFKIWRVEKKLIRNLTRRKKFDSKTDNAKKIYFKLSQEQKFLIENHAFYKNFFLQNNAFRKKFFLRNRAFQKYFFSSKSCFFKKTFYSQSCFLKLHVKCKMCAFYAVNWIKTWIFDGNFFSKPVFQKIFLFKNLLFQNYAF